MHTYPQERRHPAAAMSARAHRAVSASLAPLLVLLLLLQAAPARGAVYHVADEPGEQPRLQHQHQ